MALHSNKWKILPVLGAFLCSGSLFLSTTYALDIRIKESVTVKGDRILLGEIASFDPEDDPRIAELAKIEVASAPSPGNAFSLNSRFLNNKIGSAVGDKEDISVKVPADLMVRRAAQFVSDSQLKEIFKEYILDHAPWDEKRMTFESINTPGDIALPEGELHWTVREMGNQSYAGNVPLVLGFSVDGKLIRRVSLSGKISVSQEVIKTARRIERGQLISKEDLIPVTENRLRLRKDLLTGLDEAIGKRSVRSIQAGQIMTAQMIEDPPLVSKGNRVLIKAENEVIRVTVPGTVLGDGRMGDQVKVVNSSSGKESFATVKGPELVEVSF